LPAFPYPSAIPYPPCDRGRVLAEPKPLDSSFGCSHFVLCIADRPKRTANCTRFGLIEELRAECKRTWGTSSELYFRIDELLRELANPNLHEMFSTSAFQVELWDQRAERIRWVVAATASITIGHAAFDAAVGQYSGQRVALRKGATLIREYPLNKAGR
jgi:hypothetical protein